MVHLADITNKRLTGVCGDYQTGIKKHAGRRLGEKNSDIFLWWQTLCNSCGRISCSLVQGRANFDNDDENTAKREEKAKTRGGQRSSNVFRIFIVAA